MAESKITATFPHSVEAVWNTVTSLENYGWRSDISRIEVLDESQFVEYAKNGFATTFTVTKKEPPFRWEFDMENANLSGHWTGVLCDKGGQTQITFTESVTAKKAFLRPLVKLFLKKQQAQYVADLQKVLGAELIEKPTDVPNV